MRLSLSTKLNRRIFATIVGIAFCVTYLAGTTAMVQGLHDTTSTLASSFDQGPMMILTDQDLSVSRIDGSLLPGNDTTYVAFCFANVTLRDFHGGVVENVYAVSVHDPENVLGLNMSDDGNQQTLIGSQLVRMLGAQGISTGQNVRYVLERGENTAQVRLNNVYSTGSIFPDDWLMIPREAMDMLRPDMAGNYSFLVLLDSDVALDAQPFMTPGTEAIPTSGVVGFFEAGIYQVEQDLWGIIAITGLMTALLVYCIISIETDYYAPTIRILRGMGASRGFVVQIFLLKALFITLAGGVLGTALGFCAASAISSVSSLLGVVTFVTPSASFDSAILPTLISMIAGLVGGAWPAVRASRAMVAGRDAR